MPPPIQMPNETLPTLNPESPAQMVDRPSDAAGSIYDTLTKGDFSIDEKLAVRKRLDQLIRLEIDEKIAALQSLRSSF